MTSYERLAHQIPRIEEALGIVFENKDLLILAFIHRSYANERRGETGQHNERLEFLGDSVLGLVIAEYLFRRLPTYPEGELSQLRSRLVDASACTRFIQKLKLSEYILLGKGERLNEGQMKGSILADVFEAIVGAIYLDSGIGTVRSFMVLHFETDIEEAIGRPAHNYKAELQDYSQKKFQKPPLYRVIDESGPDHAKIFHVAVLVGQKELGAGKGSSKKEAEQRAAFEALSKIEATQKL
jgi:ribonuclease-3